MRSHLTPGDIDDVSYKADGSRDWLIPTDNWDDIEDWHWACQLQQAQTIRFGVEHMRSLEPINAGALIWQLNDDWPVVSWAAVDYDGHRKPLWYASRDFFAPRPATIQPRISKKQWEDRSGEGKRPAADKLALVALNDTREPWAGTWTVGRRTLEGEVLASQRIEVSLGAVDHATVYLEHEVATFADASDEIIVAAADRPGFARVVFNGVEAIDQQLQADPLDVKVEKAEHGYTMTLIAHAYARDVFCMADKVDADASADGGMVPLLPGESVTWTISSGAEVEPGRFAAPNVLRCANDLKR